MVPPSPRPRGSQLKRCLRVLIGLLCTSGALRANAASAPAAIAVVRGETEAERQLSSELGPGFRLLRTEHFRVAYDTSVEFAEFHAGLFEAVYGAFFDFFRSSGFLLNAPNERLEAALFDSREEFRSYAIRRDAALGESGGFYASADNRIAFFDSFQDAQYLRLRERIRGTEVALRQTQERLAAMQAETVVITHGDGKRQTVSRARAQRMLARKQRRLERDRRQMTDYFHDRNLTTTIHECVHQLAFNTGVQRIGADNPKWLGEGIATYFETVGYRDVGPTGSRNPERAAAFRRAEAAGSLIPLDQLLTDDRLFSATDPRAATAYGQAWALVSYLLAERPGAFFGYLRMVSRTRAGQPDREPARLVGFRQAFGEDFAAVEAAVAAYVTSLG